MKGQGLEFTLRAIADQRHAPAVRARQVTGGQGRGGSGADGGGQGHFTEQHRSACVDIAQGAEGHDREHAALGILRVAVDVLEGVQVAVGYRH
ncbi:hypothetical protein D3C72_1625870 [compost metagenome]